MKALGAVSVGSTEIYGVINDDFINSCIPDMVWATLKDRESGLPMDLIRIGNDELGSPYIRVSDRPNESPIIAYHIGLPAKDQTYEILADSFGDYFLDKVQQEIDFLI